MKKERTLKEVEETYRRQAKQFRALQKVLSNQGSFQSMQRATICAGLAEVAESFADQTKRRDVK